MGRSSAFSCSYRCTQRALKYALVTLVVCLFFFSAIIPLLPRHVQLQTIRSNSPVKPLGGDDTKHMATQRRMNNIKNKVEEIRQNTLSDADTPSHTAPIAAKTSSPLSIYPLLKSNSTLSPEEEKEAVQVPLSIGFSPPRCPQQAWWPLDSQGRPFDPDVEASRQRLFKRRTENSDLDADQEPIQQMHSGFGVPPGKPFRRGATKVAADGSQHSWYRSESSPPTPLQKEILRLPYLPLAESTVAIAMLPFPFWQSRGEFDSYSSAADLTWVSFHGGVLHIYGTEDWSDDERKRITEFMPKYKHLKNKWEVKPSLGEQVQFHHLPLEIDTCDEIIEESTFFLSSWITTSMYNSHNDNLLPIFSNLRSVGLLHPQAKRRLYLWKSDDFDKRVPWMTLLDALFNHNNIHDAEKELFRDPGLVSKKCFRHIRWGRGPLLGYVRDAVPFSKDCTNIDHLYPLPHESLFQDSQKKVLDLRVDDQEVDLATQDKRLRFLHGQGVIAGDVIAFQRHWLEYFDLIDVEAIKQLEKPAEGAVVVRGVKRLAVRQDPFENEEAKKPVNTGARLNRLISGERRDLDLDPLSHVELKQCVIEQKYPRIVFLDRFGDNRRIENADQFIELIGKSRSMGGLELNVTRCCDWDAGLNAGAVGGSRALDFVKEQIKIFQQADILISFNGAAHTLQLYIPPGAVIVELQGEGYIHNQLYNRLSRWLDHLHLNVDVRKHFRSMALPYVFPDTTSYEIVAYALSHWKRHYPCHAHEEKERLEFYDKKHAFNERFTMGNPKNDRKELVNWSMLDD